MLNLQQSFSLATLILISITAFGQQATVADFGFYDFSHPDHPTDTIRYRMLTPYQYDPQASTEYPVFIWLHPNGRQGTNNTEQMKDGWSGYLMDASMRVTYPSFVIAPQCAPGSGWWDHVPSENILNLLDSLITAERIDASRIYIMGWSMGGFGIWRAMEKNNRLGYFAAAVPIAGVWSANSSDFDPEKYAGTAIWAGHGSNDRRVNVSGHRQRIAAIRAAGYDAVYSEFPIPHGSHDETMAEPGIWPWLFCQDRDGGSLPPAPTILQVAASGSVANLTWDIPSVSSSVDTIMAYHLYKNGNRITTGISDLADSTGTGINELLRVNTYVDSNYTAGDVYQVTAVNFRNQESSLTTSLSEPSDRQEQIVLYPNPAQSHLQIRGNLPINTAYSILTIDGRTVQKGILTGPQIDVQALEKGMYLLQISNTATIRFIKE